jgi:hypothetical protein
MKNFPYEDEGIGTGLKFSIRHISKPRQGIKDNRTVAIPELTKIIVEW